MKYAIAFTLGFVLIVMCSSYTKQQGEKTKYYTLHFASQNKNEIKEYRILLDKGIKQVAQFFGARYSSVFEVRIYNSRTALDSAWQKDWGDLTFKSECWMVASGVAKKLDMIAPKKWDSLSCEHKYADKQKMQQLITHELVHVFHGQQNVSPDFSNTEGIDWFVEGLATYASGQLDSARMQEVKKLASENKLPGSLDKCWSGKYKYGIAGSLVACIDKNYGRKKLIRLLSFNKKEELLNSLNTDEKTLLESWKNFLH